MVLALALGVSLGGQTIDYTWGPALLALALALPTACGGASAFRERGKGTWIALAFLIFAWGWILWRCSSSPVREYARADALLAGGMIAGCVWALLAAPRGAAVRILMVGLTLLGLADLGIGLCQLRDPLFAWPFASRSAQPFPSGLIGHYNHLADFSLVSAAFLAARFLYARDSRPERVLQALGFVAAVSCVVMSGSRGGATALGTALAVLVVTAAFRAWRDKSKQARSLGIAAVVTLVLLAVAWVVVVRHSQERRGIQNGGVEKFADNYSRLLTYGQALDMSLQHPLAGGGSRSFGWLKYAAWKPEESGLQPKNDDFVHNELLQSAVEYGWGGALLIGAAALASILCSVAGLLSGGSTAAAERARRGPVDAMMCGGLAAMSGTLMHSNFSFVTHTIPGAIYLGLAIGFALPRRLVESYPSAKATLLALLILSPLAGLLAWAGFRGSSAYRQLWPVSFGREQLGRIAPGLGMERMRAAIDTWPAADLSGSAGNLARQAAVREGLSADEAKDWFAQAADRYADARKLNPFDPEWAINRANVLSAAGRDADADAEYEAALRLQGGMEGTFRVRYYYARHLFGRYYRDWKEKQCPPERAMAGFIRARDLLKEAAPETEQWIRGKEEADLLKGVEDMVSFMEGAHIVPDAEAK